MPNMKKIVISTILVLALSTSCEKWIDTSMNDDPNNPKNVAMSALVAPVEVNLAYIVGGELARWDCTWMQQIAGLQSQAADIEIYTIGESDCTNAWSYNLYAPGFISLKILLDKAKTTNSPHYAGIGKILMAYHLGVTTDHWGDIPYSDALNGYDLKFRPKYDTQQQIYTAIFTLLNEAIADLNQATSLLSPGSEDIIYGGDLSLWIKTAYALKARYSMHLAKRNGNSAYSDAIAAIANSYTSNDEDFKVTFGAAYNNSNPIYQFESERYHYIAASSTYMNMLDATGDPRKAVYFDGDDSSDPGAYNSDAAAIGVNYASSASPVYLISYAELKFIEAEARYRLNPTDPDAVTAYNDGLKASLDREGVDKLGTWYNAHLITPATISLENIMNQKYLSSYLQVETWSDWRRTGYPTLTLAEGAVTTAIPRRLPYPSDERLYNGENMPTGLTVTSRLWWDN
jgi:hypothetical protein